MKAALLLILLALGLCGCAALYSLIAPEEVRVPGIPYGLRPGDVWEASTQMRLSRDQMLERLREIPVVFVGETHNQIGDHEVQLEIISGLQAAGGSMAIGMEMFQRRHQEALDRFVRGDLDEAGLQEAVDWSASWGYDFELYAPILRFAREHHIPILALNAPQELVRKVARRGLSGLSPEESEALPRPWPSLSDDYRTYLQRQYQGDHHGEISSFEHFTEAQRLWDATMAEALAEWIQGRRGPEGLHVIVLAGKGHVMRGMGIPQALEARIALPYSVVISVHPGEGEQIDVHTADYLAVVSN